MNSSSDESQPTESEYRVVALRYRPQNFSELVGQQHIGTALTNAITQSRVGHAYLFTGARGVGKTSSARIFAKCLNCKSGPSVQPCDECDICKAVSEGEDVDVLEIDGASNRGIDEIRQLRSNAAVRPSRARFKIYIIDEVHMLTMQAFNALLKTLEEPPAHVKFIFCTTDPQKIPITVLSRCQRFDFSPVQTDKIAERLKSIIDTEGVEADEDALALLARRANGSMRDSQSLLEQLLSFCDEKIRVEDVHQLLGTADIGRISELAGVMAARDTAATLNLINLSSNEGIHAGQLATQLLGYFRDVMAARVGCGADTLLTCSGSDLERLTELAAELGLETILSIIQILDTAIVKMQTSLHVRTLLEVATIRICNLENLESIPDLVKQLAQAGGQVVTTQKRNVPQPRTPRTELEKVTIEPAVKKNVTVNDTTDDLLTSTQIEAYWSQMLQTLGDLTADMAADFEKIEVQDSNKIVVRLNSAYHSRECSKPERKQKIETTLAKIAGRKLKVDFQTSHNQQAAVLATAPQMTRAQQIRKLHEHDFVKQTMNLFDAEVNNFHQPEKTSV